MNINKIKSYSSTNLIDKYKNPICVNDILLSCGLPCIYVKTSEKNPERIIVAFADGKMSKINPRNAIRLDTMVSKLKNSTVNFLNKANEFEQYTKIHYIKYSYDIYEFFSQYKNRSVRLLRKKFNTTELDDEIHPINYNNIYCGGYIINDTLYTDRHANIVLNLDNEKALHIDKSYNKVYLLLNSKEKGFNNAFNANLYNIKMCIADFIEKEQK